MSKSIKEQLANPIKPSDFYNILHNHDWFFSYSDDGRVWKEGQAMEKCIVSCALRNEFANFMYCKFTDARSDTILSGKQHIKPKFDTLKSLYGYSAFVQDASPLTTQESNPPWV